MASDTSAPEASAEQWSADGSSNARKALAEIDKALATKPDVDGHVFSACAGFLSSLRDEIASRQREVGASAESRRRLEHVNAVISVVLGAHFPLGSVPWPELEKARGWLVELANQVEAER
jgi:hypothetical protein